MSCRTRLPAIRQALLALTVFAAGVAGVQPAAQAQGGPYKVIGPDGRVTYTDRPPVGGTARRLGVREDADALSAQASNGVVLAELPFELRAVVQRFPVLLLAADNCSACDLGRAALRQRGIPFGERRVQSRADIEALRRSEGAQDLPVLRVGGQHLRGYDSEAWAETLDVAGYPRASVLSSRYKAPPVEPLVAASDGAAAARRPPARAAAASAPAGPNLPPAPDPARVRF